MAAVEIGGRYRLKTTGATTHHHDGRACVVVRELGPDEVDRDEAGRMFVVRVDGTDELFEAFEDELLVVA